MADKPNQQPKTPQIVPPKPSGKLELDVNVASSAKVFYEGKARSVSSKNTVGPFDILPKHENFISLVREKITIFDLAGKKFEFPIDNGLLEVSEDKVRIFVGV